MASTVGTRMLTGTIDGTGSAIDILTPSFTPRRVTCYNIDNTGGKISVDWFEPMPPASGFKTVAAGTRSYITSDGITPNFQRVMDDGTSPGRGFTIGADSDLNAANEVIMWVAYE